MGLLFENGDIEIMEPVLDEKCEYRLETEVYLPDYLPDIQKLLRCEIIPRVGARNMLAGRINIEGEAEIRIFYKSAADERISCVSVLKEFSHTVAVSEPDEQYDITTRTASSVNSVRASGPRKISVKGEISTYISAVKMLTLQVAEKVSSGIEARREKIEALASVCVKERELRITEELELPETAPSVSALLYTDVKVAEASVSVNKGQCVLKGELVVTPVYSAEGSIVPEKQEFRFPLTQIAELPDADDNSMIDGEFEIVSVYAEPEADADGNSRIIDCEVVLNGVVRCFKSDEYTVITDVFSPSNELSVEYASAKYLTCCDILRDSKSLRGQLECENSIGSVLDIAASTKILRVSSDNGCVKAEGIVSAELIYATGEGTVSSAKGEIPFDFALPYSCNCDIRCEAEAAASSLSYNISGENTIDVRCEAAVKISICAERELRAVSDIAVIGEKADCHAHPITLYFAEKGECVWDIAKRYGGSVADILTENSIEGEYISASTMLMIPQKQ